MAESAANRKVSSCLACCTHTWLLLGATEASWAAYFWHQLLCLRGLGVLWLLLKLLCTGTPCRHGLQVCSSSKGVTPAELAQCRLALGLALGKMARMTVVPQKDRSEYRCKRSTGRCYQFVHACRSCLVTCAQRRLCTQ